MKITTKGRYAVMAMVDLAVQGGAKPTPLADIAGRRDISLAYLEQLFCKLRRARLVRSVRGPGGGYLLARSGAEVRICEILRAVDEQIRCCDQGAPGAALDPTLDLWLGLGHRIEHYLSSISLADVAEGRVAGAGRELVSDAAD